jgi:hypothetical protein
MEDRFAADIVDFVRTHQMWYFLRQKYESTGQSTYIAAIHQEQLLRRVTLQLRSLGVDVARLEASFLQAASDEVVPHPDVLAPFMKNGVLCQGQSGLAVHPEFHRSSVSAEEIIKQSNKPERLSRSDETAMYSASQLDKVTICCLTDC